MSSDGEGDVAMLSREEFVMGDPCKRITSGGEDVASTKDWTVLQWPNISFQNDIVVESAKHCQCMNCISC